MPLSIALRCGMHLAICYTTAKYIGSNLQGLERFGLLARANGCSARQAPLGASAVQTASCSRLLASLVLQAALPEL